MPQVPNQQPSGPPSTLVSEFSPELPEKEIIYQAGVDIEGMAVSWESPPGKDGTPLPSRTVGRLSFVTLTASVKENYATSAIRSQAKNSFVRKKRMF